MNAGFETLEYLKKQLLAVSLQNDKRWDDQLCLIGRGVAGQFERYCGRKFFRMVNATQIIPGDRVDYLLERYPVESVSQMQLLLKQSQGWQPLDMNCIVSTIDLRSGIIHLDTDSDLAGPSSQVQITYTGGYWWQTCSKDDPDYSAVPPAGANLLPQSIRLAWIMQCRKIWESIDKTGKDILQVGSNPENYSQSLGALDLIPLVKSALEEFVRYTMI